MLQSALDVLARDPVLGYSLLAAGFLFLVAWASGLARLDGLVLLEPTVLLQLGLGVALGFALTLLGRSAGAALSDLGLLPDAVRFGGLGRFPLYLLALAYGPTVGLAATGLFAAFELGRLGSAWPLAVLGLELALLGWLAIYPSPRDHRWAGPLNAVLAYLLAWATGGLALLQWSTGEVSAAALLEQHRQTLGGAALAALLLAAVGPASYLRLFPTSRIADLAPEQGAAAPAAAEPEPVRQRHHPGLTDPGVPRRLERRRRDRELDPPPTFED